MARRPQPQPIEFKRLSPSQLRELGLKPGSKRYYTIGNFPTRQNATDVTISERKYFETKNAREFNAGQKLTKEQRTKKLIAGEVEYRNSQAFKTIVIKGERNEIRRMFSKHGKTISDKDLNILWKVRFTGPDEATGHRLNWGSMTKAEGRRLDEMKGDYGREVVYEALGSPLTKES